MKLQDVELTKITEFKYLRSTVQSNQNHGQEIKKRVIAAWNEWRNVTGVICDKRVSAKVKGKVYKSVTRPAMLYDLETVSFTKKQEAELEMEELKMLHFSMGVTNEDKIRNEYTRGAAQKI